MRTSALTDDAAETHDALRVRFGCFPEPVSVDNAGGAPSSLLSHCVSGSDAGTGIEHLVQNPHLGNGDFLASAAYWPLRAAESCRAANRCGLGITPLTIAETFLLLHISYRQVTGCSYLPSILKGI